MLRFLALAAAALLASSAAAQPLAIVGGTLIDVRHAGRSSHDIPDAVVVIQGDRIAAAGSASAVRIPRGARRIDARGRFIVPGLIDGFGALRSQGFANAHLYHGVTTVFQVDVTGADERRGKPFLQADPSPRLFAGYSITGFRTPPGAFTAMAQRQGGKISDAEVAAEVERGAAQGARLIWLGYGVSANQLRIAVRAARAHRLPTMGELGDASYADAVEAGVTVLVHEQRYLADFAPAEARAAYALRPFNGPAIRPVVEAEARLDPASPQVAAFGDRLARAGTALLPTFSIFAQGYTPWRLPDPWRDPAGPLVRPDELFMPVDPATRLNERARGQGPEERAFQAAYVANLRRVDAALRARGAHYLAASGTSAFGVLPGAGLHLEFGFLTEIGLTPREVLASATGNFAEVYGWRDVGLVEPGRFADLLVLRSDPRRSIAALDDIAVLVAGGRRIDREALLAWRPPSP